MASISIILPVIDAASDAALMLTRLQEQLQQYGEDTELIVVLADGRKDKFGLPSGPASSARCVFCDPGSGFAAAAFAGLREAHGSILLIIPLESPEAAGAFRQFVEPLLRDEADCVLGTRYGAAGGDGVNRPRLVARWKRLAAHPLAVCTDPASRHIALHKNALRGAQDKLDADQDGVALELIVKCGLSRIVEVPVPGCRQSYGKEQSGLRETLRFTRQLARLYRHRYPGPVQLLQFLMVGGSGMVVDLTCYALLLLVLPVSIARALAIWCAMTWNFFLNRKYTFFESRRDSLVVQYLGFCGSCLVGAVVNWSTSVALVGAITFFMTHKLVAAVLGIIAGTAFNFILCRYLVFRSEHQR
jgi:dolichol-phosphate mannosyltransferase